MDKRKNEVKNHLTKILFYNYFQLSYYTHVNKIIIQFKILDKFKYNKKKL